MQTIKETWFSSESCLLNCFKLFDIYVDEYLIEIKKSVCYTLRQDSGIAIIDSDICNNLYENSNESIIRVLKSGGEDA